LRAKYDELDSNVKIYINIGGVVLILLVILITVLTGMSKVSGLKSEIAARNELINYLLTAEERIKFYKAQKEAFAGNADMSSTLNDFVQKMAQNSGYNSEKLTVTEEKNGQETKETKEVLVDINLTQTNIRTFSQFLFNMTNQGSPRNLTIKDLTIDTKGDPLGYIDATLTVATYKAK
jgi:Na+-transporting methylmalonyl-CoA/oxaloacetate decarboxylase gamma subunit